MPFDTESILADNVACTPVAEGFDRNIIHGLVRRHYNGESLTWDDITLLHEHSIALENQHKTAIAIRHVDNIHRIHEQHKTNEAPLIVDTYIAPVIISTEVLKSANTNVCTTVDIPTGTNRCCSTNIFDDILKLFRF